MVSTYLLTPSIQSFRQRFPVQRFFTDEKVIDTLIWKFVRLLTRGAIRNCRILYT
jgi:hypothetical protein